MFFVVTCDHKYPLCTLVSKSNVTLVQPLRLKKIGKFLHGSYCLVIVACIFMPENETLVLILMD